jgi:hypothetical protein
MWKYFLLLGCLSTTLVYAQQERNKGQSLVPVAEGWANNSVNAVIFRKNSLVSFRDTQFIAYYDADRYVVIGKRKIGTAQWQLQKTAYQGNSADAHNAISIMVDGHGFLHMAWDHHNHPLRYVKSIAPGALELTGKMDMTGANESNVSYPEFYRVNNGNLLFLYRDGRSGGGNLVINHYDINTKKWAQFHSNLVDGSGERNAYWQAFIDVQGTVHLSWVWRETPDVASNHDICYARSKDEGRTWERSNGDNYALPITAKTAEYAWRVPENRELINQTSMYADENGYPYIATYWREPNSDIPQYHLVYRTSKGWKEHQFYFRKTGFSLSGEGTKRIPVSRPQVLIGGEGKRLGALIIFRDEERGSKASAIVMRSVKNHRYKIIDLTARSLGAWEPTYDTELWKEEKLLHLFVQNVEQVDGEGQGKLPAQLIQVLEWQPKF